VCSPASRRLLVDVEASPGVDLGARPIRAGVSYDVMGEGLLWVKSLSMRECGG
jgi:hypothetical protein